MRIDPNHSAQAAMSELILGSGIWLGRVWCLLDVLLVELIGSCSVVLCWYCVCWYWDFEGRDFGTD